MLIALGVFLSALAIHVVVLIRARAGLTAQQVEIVDSRAGNQTAKIWMVAIPGGVLYLMSILYPQASGYLYLLGVPLLLGIMLFNQVREEIQLRKLGLPRTYLLAHRAASIVLWIGLLLAIYVLVAMRTDVV